MWLGRLILVAAVAFVAAVLIYGSVKSPDPGPRLVPGKPPPATAEEETESEPGASEPEGPPEQTVAFPSPGTPVPNLAPRAVVERVVDGDTIRLTDGRSVRLVQIDAPEPGDNECYAVEATRELAALLPRGRRVRLETDPALDSVDVFGRVLAYVHLGRSNLNLSMVSRGAATPWFYDGKRGKYARELLSSVRLARAVQKGLWAACPGTRLDPTKALRTVGPGVRTLVG